MGGSRFDSNTYARYASTTLIGKNTTEIFQSRTIDPDLNPRDILVRESRDSIENPESNAIIIGLDVTGSMGMILDSTIRNLNVLMEEIYSRKPVSDPHIMCMGIGDVAARDSAPLQVSQFEADIKIAEQLQKIYIERGGGCNHYESYTLPWYFAATKTEIDCFEKRGRKGYIFTVGDEEVTPRLTKSDIQTVMGIDIQQPSLSAQELYDMVTEKYHVFHLMIEEGSYMRSHSERVIEGWTNLLGQFAIRVPDHRIIAETVVTAIMVNEGMSPEAAVREWNDETTDALSLSFNLRRD